VVHDNKVTKNYGVNQFQSKRYPDEDATNPFEGQGGGTFWDYYGTFWDIYGTFGTFTSNSFQGQGGGAFWFFYIQPFSGPRRLDILGLLWDILGLLHPTLSRAKEVGHFGTFASNPFHGQWVGHFGAFMGHFGTFTSSPFQGQGSEHFGHFTSLHPTLLRDNRTRWWDI
jgi:hypothetical protein